MFGLIRYCINGSAPPNRRAARAPDEKYLPSPEPLTQIQNNFTESVPHVTLYQNGSTPLIKGAARALDEKCL